MREQSAYCTTDVRESCLGDMLGHWGVASSPLGLTPVSSLDEGVCSEPGVGTGTRAGLGLVPWEDMHVVRADPAGPKGPSRPRCFRGLTEEEQETPVAFGSEALRTKARGGLSQSFVAQQCPG